MLTNFAKNQFISGILARQADSLVVALRSFLIKINNYVKNLSSLT